MYKIRLSSETRRAYNAIKKVYNERLMPEENWAFDELFCDYSQMLEVTALAVGGSSFARRLLCDGVYIENFPHKFQWAIPGRRMYRAAPKTEITNPDILGRISVNDDFTRYLSMDEDRRFSFPLPVIRTEEEAREWFDSLGSSDEKWIGSILIHDLYELAQKQYDETGLGYMYGAPARPVIPDWAYFWELKGEEKEKWLEAAKADKEG